MKKVILFSLIIVSVIASKAQTPNWLWAFGGGGGLYQWGCGAGVDDSSNMYISGRFAGTMTFGTQSITNTQNSDGVFFGKFDKNGTCLWLKQHPYSSFDYDYALGFYLDDSANVYGSGLVGSGFGMYVAKYSRGGTLDYSSTNGTGGGSYGSSPNSAAVAADHDGYAYATGSLGGGSYTFGSSTLTYAGTGASQMMFLTKLDRTGNYIWAVSASGNGTTAGNDGGRGIVVDHTSQYVYVSGSYVGTPTFGSSGISIPPSSGYANLFLAKYDSSGNPIWVATASSAGIAYNSGFQSIQSDNAVVVDSCGNAFITGFFQNTAQFGNITITASTNSNGTDAYVAKCNSNGQWEWVEDISSGHSTSDWGRAISIDKNGDVYALGRFDSTANFGSGITRTALGSSDLFVAKYANSNGALQWVQDACTGDFNSEAYGIAVDEQTFVYVTGAIWNTITPTFGSITVPSTGNGNVFVAKLDTVTARTVIPALSLSYCPGSTENISYTITGIYNNGNVFTAQLSDSTGSFSSYVDLGDTTSTTSGSIRITIPDTTKPGSHYLIRIVSSSPAGSSNTNGCGYYNSNNFYITIGGNLNVSTTPDTSVCSGATINLNVTGGISYKWSNGDTTSTITVTPTTDTIYHVMVSSGSCVGYDSVKVNVTPVTNLTLEPNDTSFCNGQSATLHINGGGSDFMWSPTSGLNVDTGNVVVASPTITTTYTVTGTSSGCAATGIDVVGIIPSPNTPSFTQTGDTLISSSKFDNQWYRNDSLLVNDTSQDLTVTIPGEYKVIVTNEANGCSTSSDSAYVNVTGIEQLAGISNQVSIYPNPFNSNIYIQINSSAEDVKDWNLQVTDVLGRTICSKQSLNYSNDIDLSNLSSGVYFITMIMKTGKVVFPVVKQN